MGCIGWKVLEALSLTLFGTMSPPSPFPFPRHSSGSAPHPPRGAWTPTPSLETVGGQDFVHGALAGRAVPTLSLVCSPGGRLRNKMSCAELFLSQAGTCLGHFKRLSGF